MDDRTLIICAATICLVGFPLAQKLGTTASGRDLPHIASVGALGDQVSANVIKLPARTDQPAVVRSGY